ncbi:MAG: hypothetical protein ABIA93_04830 [Candidatus Woesearchaeota archaeon]
MKTLPSIIFQDRRLAILESIVAYLKEKEKCTYHEIAELTNRDDRTIWTTYQRSLKKRKKN